MTEKCCDKEFEGKWFQHHVIRAALIAGGLATAAFVLKHANIIPTALEITVYIISIIVGGRHWFREGIEKLIKKKQISIEVLMMAATLGSALLGMWDEAAFLVFLYGAAEGLEEYTFAKTRASIRKLLDLAPAQANILRNGEEIQILSKDIQIDDVFIVRPGESIPTDGIILKGNSSINEAPVTGESTPVDKTVGMKVFAATMNQVGVLEVKSTTTFANNSLSKIVHLVEEAQEQKGKTQLFIEKFGRIYTPFVLMTALILLVVPLLFNLSFLLWASKAVVLLVAAAPCALIMSTPVAIAAGIGRAGKTGILIKGGMHLENLGKIKAIAFDKTGTLTKGKPEVAEIIPLGKTEEKILEWAYSVEKSSEHPLAQAIVTKAQKMGVKPIEISNFRALMGAGAQADAKNETIYIGKVEFFKELGHDISKLPRVEELRRAGNTVIVVGTKQSIAGLIALRDEVRAESKKVIEELHKAGIKVAMLTGDNELTAKAIGDFLGIDQIKASLKPEDKIRAIEELKKQYRYVAMVGDGINDAPALANATVGIAMGTGGSDAAIEASDAALMGDDLSKVLYAIKLGKKARKVSLQNITFSLVLLAILIPSALAGIMTVAVAVFIHETSELLAVANGLRLTRA
ncbi:MAG TPA: heavy metal translocating P-type ATPase [Candidatus Omnitrophica bacterium]|nr:heavy metal translocating P-type ATPase [Candidatus Omnitrophota bacterium]